MCCPESQDTEHVGCVLSYPSKNETFVDAFTQPVQCCGQQWLDTAVQHMAEVASHSPTAEDANDTHTAGAEKGSVAAAADGATQAAGEGSGGRQHDGTGLLLPVARIKKMMKEAPDIKNVSADASWAVGRATELFLQELAARALTTTAADSNKKVLDYKDVAAGVHSWAALDFLKEMVPQKVKVGDVRQQLQKQLEEFMPKVLNDD